MLNFTSRNHQARRYKWQNVHDFFHRDIAFFSKKPANVHALIIIQTTAMQIMLTVLNCIVKGTL